MDLIECRNAMLSYVFCMRDLALYLDTHPTDVSAIAEYDRCRAEFLRLKAAYLAAGGVWTVEDMPENGSSWKWVCGPWPWEYTDKRGQQ